MPDLFDLLGDEFHVFGAAFSCLRYGVNHGQEVGYISDCLNQVGFGFGILKGLIMATLIFLLFVMGCDLVYGADEKRPEWMTISRTYPLLNASGDAMSEFVREQRLAADSGAEAAD